MLKIEAHEDNAKKAVEAEVIKTLEEHGYTLNTVNNYGENLLHISAANGCSEIVKKILDQKDCHVIDRKNKFGWTPLMQAIRNRDIDTVKLLLEHNSNVNESTYLGMSVLGLAAAISKEMFEIVYKACPNALANTANDDINPLCVAAMKNDKELFFRLLELGMPLSTANDYTHIMMRRSTIPEIANLAKEHLAIEDYWDDTSDNIQVMNEPDNTRAINESELDRNITTNIRERCTINGNENKNNEESHFLLRDRPKPADNEEIKRGTSIKLDLLSMSTESGKQDLISPVMTYNCDELFIGSPNICFITNDSVTNTNEESVARSELQKHAAIDKRQFDLPPPVVLQRLQSVRPANLDTSFQDDLNATLDFTPEFSPLRSPHVPPDINDENVFGENTPTPPRCKTPPKGILLNSQQAQMVKVLRRFGLNQHIPMFLEQEVDIDLFLTLTDNDLIEIGVKYEKDRCALLKAIKEYRIVKTAITFNNRELIKI